MSPLKEFIHSPIQPFIFSYIIVPCASLPRTAPLWSIQKPVSQLLLPPISARRSSKCAELLLQLLLKPQLFPATAATRTAATQPLKREQFRPTAARMTAAWQLLDSEQLREEAALTLNSFVVLE